MSHIEGEILIWRRVEDVFDFVADERNEPRYNPRMLRVEKLTDGEIGIGTKFAATTNSGRETADMIIEVTAFDRPRRLASATTLPSMSITGTSTLEPAGAATRMRWSWELRPRGALKLLGPIVTVVGRRNETAIWADLKRLLESEGDNQAGASTSG